MQKLQQLKAAGCVAVRPGAVCVRLCWRHWPAQICYHVFYWNSLRLVKWLIIAPPTTCSEEVYQPKAFVWTYCSQSGEPLEDFTTQTSARLPLSPHQSNTLIFIVLAEYIRGSSCKHLSSHWLTVATHRPDVWGRPTAHRSCVDLKSGNKARGCCSWHVARNGEVSRAQRLRRSTKSENREKLADWRRLKSSASRRRA